MPAHPMRGVGQRIATARRARRLTQAELADAAQVSLSMLTKIERDARLPGDDTLDAIAAALGIDPSRLMAAPGHLSGRVHLALPALSAAIAGYDIPDGGPHRPLAELRAPVAEAVTWRLAAQYVRLALAMPDLITELTSAFHAATGRNRAQAAALLVSAYRSADAVAYKYGARDLSARLIELMRWAAPFAEDDLLTAAVGYVRTETFFAARAHTPGLRALEQAIDTAPAPGDTASAAARGALHMRAAVIASRAADEAATALHLGEARQLADQVPESVYGGTAFGPDSVRIHELSAAVGLGDRGVQRAVALAREWAPPRTMPAERRSGFYVELSRAQMWAGRRDDAFESLKVARRIAPQHCREHAWARETTESLLRLSRADADGLAAFAEWIGAA